MKEISSLQILSSTALECYCSFVLNAQNLLIKKFTGTLMTRLMIGPKNSEIWKSLTHNTNNILFKNSPVKE